MRSLLVAVSVLASLGLAAPASADAIMPFDGACPPGLERAIRDHAEVCSPAACRTSHDCPEGSSCATLFECWASRSVSHDRSADAEPVTMEVPVGPCGDDHHCSEGVCRERRQCEPTDATAAWNRSERRWTREAYVASSGCNAGSRTRHVGASTPLLALLAFGLLTIRRSR